jgi:hypothetical protein
MTLAGVTLPNPIIGNSKTLIHRVVTHMAMDGSYRSYKMGTPSFQILMKFSLKKTVYNTLKTAIKTARGSQITLVDNRGKSYTGILLNNPFEATSADLNNTCTSMDVTIQFEGR